jgi:hypothetical protein
MDANGRGEEARKACRRVNMVQILYSHKCKQKRRYQLKLFQERGRGERDWWRE